MPEQWDLVLIFSMRMFAPARRGPINTEHRDCSCTLPFGMKRCNDSDVWNAS